MASRLLAVDFEIFGVVQGVSFRAYTKRQARKLDLYGWVQNTPRQTVVGSVQGETEKVYSMKQWLQHSGSPESKIEKAVFTNERPIEKLTFTSFDIRK